MARQTKTPKARTQVKDLPKKEKKLTTEEQKKVKGGIIAPNIEINRLVSIKNS